MEHECFFHIFGISSSQLTFIFFRVETTNQKTFGLLLKLTTLWGPERFMAEFFYTFSRGYKPTLNFFGDLPDL